MANPEHLVNLSFIKGSYHPFAAGNTRVMDSTGVLHGVIINSHTSGTFKIYDGIAATSGVAVGGTYTPPTGSSVITYPRPLDLHTGLFIQASGTIDASAIVSENE